MSSHTYQIPSEQSLIFVRVGVLLEEQKNKRPPLQGLRVEPKRVWSRELIVFAEIGSV